MNVRCPFGWVVLMGADVLNSLLLIIGALGGLGGIAGIASWWYQRVQLRRNDEQRGWELLQEAKRMWWEAMRHEPELSPPDNIGPDFTEGIPRRRQPPTKEQKRQWQECLYRREELMDQVKTRLRRIADLGLPRVEDWRELFQMALEPDIKMPEVAARAGWRIYRQQCSLGCWLLLQLPPLLWRCFARRIALPRPSDELLYELSEVAFCGEALKYAPRGLRSPNHPAWEMVEMVMSRQQPLTSELPPVTEDIVIEPVAEWLVKEVSSEQ